MDKMQQCRDLTRRDLCLASLVIDDQHRRCRWTGQTCINNLEYLADIDIAVDRFLRGWQPDAPADPPPVLLYDMIAQHPNRANHIPMRAVVDAAVAGRGPLLVVQQAIRHHPPGRAFDASRLREVMRTTSSLSDMLIMARYTALSARDATYAFDTETRHAIARKQRVMEMLEESALDLADDFRESDSLDDRPNRVLLQVDPRACAAVQEPNVRHQLLDILEDAAARGKGASADNVVRAACVFLNGKSELTADAAGGRAPGAGGNPPPVPRDLR